MVHIVVLDRSLGFIELVADHLETALACRVTSLTDPDDALDLVRFDRRREQVDLLLIDPGPAGLGPAGADMVVEFGRLSPETAVVIHTSAGESDELALGVLWDAVRPAGAVAKESSIDLLDRTLATVLRRGSCPPDPALGLPMALERRRSSSTYRRLVPHRGHAKLWSALLEAPSPPSYRAIADRTGLAVNTVRNYRDDVLAELANWGLTNPTMAEMHRFAGAARPLLRPLVDERLAPRDDGPPPDELALDDLAPGAEVAFAGRATAGP